MRLCDARLGDVDLELVLRHVVLVEHADRLVGIFLRGHGHKGEALRHAGALVFDEVHRRDRPGLREQGFDFIFRGCLCEVSYVNSNIHFNTAFCPRGHIARHGRE